MADCVVITVQYVPCAVPVALRMKINTGSPLKFIDYRFLNVGRVAFLSSSTAPPLVLSSSPKTKSQFNSNL